MNNNQLIYIIRGKMKSVKICSLGTLAVCYFLLLVIHIQAWKSFCVFLQSYHQLIMEFNL